MNQLVTITLCLVYVSVSHAGITPGVSADEPHDGQALIARGRQEIPSKVPWHAGIYKPDGDSYLHMCGGSLITTNLVITAAQCFWDESINKPLPNLDKYKVTLGKLYREWDLDTSLAAVQRMDVQHVAIDPRFEGFARQQLAFDVAIVKLVNHVNLTDYVKVVHFDRRPGLPANGSIGVVAGWGVTQDGNPAAMLQSIELPYIDYDTCYVSLGDNRFKRLLTMDKFCAGFSNRGKSVCPGDSGGGFVVINNITKTATLRGIVSLDFRPSGVAHDLCYALHYTGFTNIGDSRYLDFIERQRYGGPPLPCPGVNDTSTANVGFCLKNNVDLECNQPMEPGSIAVHICKQGYRLPGNLTSTLMHCLTDGTWTDPIVTCKRRRS